MSTVAAAIAGEEVGTGGLRGRWRGLPAGLLGLAASVDVVWFYLSYVPSYIHVDRFEAGTETTPFQHRLLLLPLLRWAHTSPWMNTLAGKLTSMRVWFPRGVRPEGLLQAAVDLLAVVVAGLVARSLYKAASRTGLLTAYVYPLTLVMVTVTYSLTTMKRLRFVYDLPSLGFFAVGMWLLYFRKGRAAFAGLFLLATVNRETTLFLLMLSMLAETSEARAEGRTGWRRWARWRVWALPIPLLVCWVGWHVWVGHRFAGNPTEALPREWINVGTILWPTSWVQLLSTFAFCGPLVLVYRGLVQDPLLRRWMWIFPVWFVFMFRYGLLIETRIFGELIPYVACLAVLMAEERLLRKMSNSEVPNGCNPSLVR